MCPCKASRAFEDMGLQGMDRSCQLPDRTRRGVLGPANATQRPNPNLALKALTNAFSLMQVISGVTGWQGCCVPKYTAGLLPPQAFRRSLSSLKHGGSVCVQITPSPVAQQHFQGGDMVLSSADSHFGLLNFHAPLMSFNFGAIFTRSNRSNSSAHVGNHMPNSSAWRHNILTDKVLQDGLPRSRKCSYLLSEARRRAAC